MIYFYGYDFASEVSTTHMNNNVLGIVQHPSIAYAAAFLGSIVAIRNPTPAIVLGVLIVGAFVAATRERLYSRRPSLYYATLFFIVTGLAVSGLRSKFGLVQALDSRYRINSTVLVILLYMYLADKFRGVRVRPIILKASVCALGGLLLVFNLASNYVGERFLFARRDALEGEMLRWQRNEPPPLILVSLPGLTAENGRFTNHLESGLYDPIEPFLSKALREGIYTLPEVDKEN